MEELTAQIIAIFLISLRVAPTFAFAPPFTLLRIPTTIRVLLGISLAAWLVLSNPEQTYLQSITYDNLAFMALGEIIIGTTLMLTLQWMSAAVLMIGRSIDIQTGFGLALLIDPTTRSQRPLIGTIFAYAVGAVFFSLEAPLDLLAIWAESIRQIPLGSPLIEPNIPLLLTFISTVFLIATGLAGIILLTLFLIDLTVAFLSRTLPQMNVLLIGFQVKTLAVLATLPLAISYSTAAYIRLVRISIETIPELAW